MVANTLVNAIVQDLRNHVLNMLQTMQAMPSVTTHAAILAPMDEPRGFMGMLTTGLHRVVTYIQETNARAVAKKMDSQATTPTGRYCPKCGQAIHEIYSAKNGKHVVGCIAGQGSCSISFLFWNDHPTAEARMATFPTGPGRAAGGGTAFSARSANFFVERVRWGYWNALRGGKWILGVSRRGGDGVVIFSLLQQRGSVRATRLLRSRQGRASTAIMMCRSMRGANFGVFN